MTEQIKITMSFTFENEKKAEILYNALINETQYNPNNRAHAKMYLKHENIKLIIYAQDPVSARAAINSYLRWLELAQSIIYVLFSSQEKVKRSKHISLF